MPTEYLLLRQPHRNAEVVHVTPTGETVLFTGKRWPARRLFRAYRTMGLKHLPAYVRKDSGAMIKAEGNKL